MTKRPEKWPVLADDDTNRGGSGIVTEKTKKKKKGKAEHDPRTLTAARLTRSP